MRTGGHPGVPLEDWARRVAQTRRGQGMTQRDLARASGLTQQSVSKIETGKLCPLDRNKVLIAAALKCSPRRLFPWP